MLYRKADPKDAMSLKDGEMLFKLRSTDITIVQKSGTDAKDGSGITKPANVCKDKKSQMECLAEVTVKTTASSYGDYYIAVPADDSPFAGTKLAATPLDSDDTLLKSVTVSFNDKTKQAIANAGAGAVVGFGIAGPFGAVVGGVVAGAASTKGLTTPQRRLSLEELICESDKILNKNINTPENIALNLPVVIDLESALKDDEGKEKGCWHLLPDNPFVGKDDSLGNGWFYRVILKEKPFGAQSTNDYFNEMKPKHDFPYTPCQDAEIQLIWWSGLKNAVAEIVPNQEVEFNCYSFPIRVANPNFVQVVPLPKAGSITFGTVCGAYVSYTTYSGPTSGDDVDAVITAVKNIKAVQDAYNKSK
jgi:hypothetical protein